MAKKRQRGGGGGGSGGRGRGGGRVFARGRDDPFSRQRRFFHAMITKEDVEFRSLHDAHRFVEAMDTFAEKAELLSKLEDSRSYGAKRIHDVLSFIEDNGTIEDLLIRLLRNILNDETSRPLTKRLRNRVLMTIYTVPELLATLVELETTSVLEASSADVLCLFLLEISRAFVEPKQSESVKALARGLRERGGVREADRLCFVLFVDEGPKSVETPASERRRAPVAWGNDLNPPGDRHDNDSFNYRNIRLVPTLDEIRCEIPAYLPMASGQNNVIDDPGQRLLDSNFRLLREDAIQTMKINIAEQGRHWKHARIIDLHCKGNAKNKNAISSLSFVVQCFSHNKKNPDWKRSSALSYGSVIALCRNGIPVRMGNISIRNAESKKEWLNAPGGPIIGITIESEIEFGDSLREMDVNVGRNGELCDLVERLRVKDGKDIRREMDRLLNEMSTYDLVEVSQSFFTYQPILRALQSTDLVPLADELVHYRPTKSDYIPIAFNLPNDKFLKGLLCSSDTWNSDVVADSTTLDLSQAEALHHAFSSRLALIQGPPGTGKTFIGGVVARTIRENTDESIICVCYTNHALDQFLEHMLDAGETSIVRIGGRSRSDRIAPYQLREISHRQGQTQANNRPLRQVDGKLHAQHEIMQKRIAILKEPVTWKSPHGGIKTLLLEERPGVFNYLCIPNLTDEDGFSLLGRRSRKVSDDFLFKSWKNGEGFPRWLDPFMHDSDTPAFHEFWTQSQVSRDTLFEEWRQQLLEPDVNALFSLSNDFKDLMLEKQTIRRAFDNNILSQARVIGVTTTGAAQYRDMLNEKAAGVVIVEEAGEVLEAHVLASLSESTKHLILIGDHKQLRPKVETYNLTAVANRGYNLDQSLFERLVMSDLPSVSLKVQHRMRPQISDFVRSQTYPHLVDHESVLSHPNVKGLSMNVAFIDHDVAEDGANRDGDHSKTKANSYEAEICLEMVRYLLLQGYRPSDIVVLTPYVGQLLLITRLMKQNLSDVMAYVSDSDLREIDVLGVEDSNVVNDLGANASKAVRCSSIDNFQGEEANIVIVSLVRSNAKGIIGFMKEPQRVNVLLSRARYGMFLVGNADTLTSKSGKSVWSPLLDMMHQRGQVLNGLPTICQLHPNDDPMVLTRLEDFRTYRPNGGCDRPCTFRMRCGHACTKMCHPIDQGHLVAEKECCQPCRRFPPECTLHHVCPKLCKQECGPCGALVGPNTLRCGHVVAHARCHDVRSAEAINNLSRSCKVPIPHTFSPCGHSCETTCSNARSDAPRCPLLCNTPLPCGHPCKKMYVLFIFAGVVHCIANSSFSEKLRNVRRESYMPGNV